VDVFDPKRQGYKEFTAQFKAPVKAFSVSRRGPVAIRRAISFVNQAIEAPAELEVECLRA